MKRISVFLFTGLLSLWLSACGGGSGNSMSANSGTGTSGSTPSAQNPGSGTGNSGGGTTSGSGSGTGTSGGGTSSGGSGSGSSTAALAYVAGSNNNFFGIRVDNSSTISTVSGSPYALPGKLLGLAGSGNLLFASSVSSASTGNIISYRADANGALTQLATTSTTGATGEIALDSTGKFLYSTGATNVNGGSSSAIYGFSVDQNSGTLTALAGSPWAITGFGDSKPAVTANGAWVCLDMSLARTNEGAECFPRHSDGTIDPNNDVIPAASNTGIGGLALTGDSSHLLYTEPASNQVFSSQISSSKNGSPVPSQGTSPQGIVVDPSGHWAAVANNGSGNVAIFAIGSGDALAAAGTPASTGGNPAQVAFSHSGTYLFVSTTSGTVVYQFNPTTGAVTALNVSSPAPGVDGPITAM